MKRDRKSTRSGDSTFLGLLAVLVFSSGILSCIATDVTIYWESIELDESPLEHVSEDAFEYIQDEFLKANSEWSEIILKDASSPPPQVNSSTLPHFTYDKEDKRGDIADILLQHHADCNINHGEGTGHEQAVYHLFVHHILDQNDDTIWGIGFDYSESNYYGEGRTATAVYGCKVRSGGEYDERFVKSDCAHEIGHMFHCYHCSSTDCIMYETLPDENGTPPSTFCDDHLDNLEIQRP